MSYLGDLESRVFREARLKNRRGPSTHTPRRVSHRAFASPLARIAQSIEREVEIEQNHGPVRIIMKDGVKVE